MKIKQIKPIIPKLIAPKKPKIDKKKLRHEFRTTQAEEDLFNDAIDMSGLTTTTFIKKAMYEYIEKYNLLKDK